MMITEHTVLIELILKLWFTRAAVKVKKSESTKKTKTKTISLVLKPGISKDLQVIQGKKGAIFIQTL